MGRRKVYSVAVELTAHCNQKCDYCYNEWRDDDGKAMGAPESETVLARLTKLVGALEIDHVTLTGGEPFAHHGVFDVLDFLRDQKVPVQIISNGGLITERLAERLAPYNLRYIQCTLDGHTAELHEEHVGAGRNHFEKTLAGVRALRSHKIPVVGCIVITRKNAAHVREILDVWKSLDVRHIALSRFSPAGYAARHAAALLPSVADATVALEHALPFAKSGMTVTCTMPMPPCAVETERFAPIGFGTCPIGTTMQEVALGPDGKLRNCTLHRTAIGGVSDILDPSVDVAALFDAKEVTQYRARRPAFCEGCLHEHTCGGGCGAAAEWVLGDARNTPDPFVWQHVDDDFAGRLDGKRRLDVIV